MTRPHFDVVICGNGASAALLIQALAQQPAPLSVLLNVPAGRLPFGGSDASEFSNWLRQSGQQADGWTAQFVPRGLFGEFLHSQVTASVRQARNLKLTTKTSEVVGLMKQDTGWTVVFGDGSVSAKLVILATGNDMPTPIGGDYGPAVAPAIADDPWEELIVRPQDRILLVGSALTAIDVLFSLASRGHAGRITLLSRYGLLPQAHIEPAHADPLPRPFPKTIVSLLRALRRTAGRAPAPENWQGLMDAMRPYWSEIWSELPAAEQRRFLRHTATIWNMHRHRIAPAAAARLSALLGEQAHVVKGRLGQVIRNKDGSLTARIRGQGGFREIQVDRIVNCSGPNVDPEKTNDRLLENVIASRQARVSPSGVGLDVDDTNRVVSKDGEIQRTLFTIGALTRGRWWEITGVPEIAQQAQGMAKSIAAQLDTLREAKTNQPKRSWV